MKNQNKYILEEKIRFLILKHRGELSKVAMEANAPLDFVQKIAKKFQKQKNRDINLNTASFIAMEIISSHEARIAHLRQLLENLEKEGQEMVSACCKSEVEGDICKKCGNKCKTIKKYFSINEYRETIRQWMREDQILSEFAEKMGLTFKSDQPILMQKNYNLFVADRRKSIEATSSEETEILKQAEQLNPILREELRKELEKKMLQMNNGQD